MTGGLRRRAQDAIARWAPGIRPSWAPRTPTVLQMEYLECGAASLAMILAWHGRWASLEELRIACGVTRDGSKASNIVRAAQAYGLAARGFKKEPEQLDDVPMPCIVHWNFNHFVVLEGLDERHAWLNDPAQGRRRVTRESFGQSFTGVVLAFEPTASFRKAGRPPAALPIVRRLLAGSRPAVGLLLAVSATLVVPGLLLPALARLFVDDVLAPRNLGWLWPLVIGLGLTALVRGLITTFQQSLLRRLETKLSVLLTTGFLWRVVGLPLSFFQQRHAGDIVTRLDANESLTRLISGALATNAVNLVSVIFFAAALLAYDAGLAALCIAIAAINVAASALVARRRDELNRTLGVERGKVASATVGIVRTIDSLKAGGLEDDAFAGWVGRYAVLLEAERRLGLYALVDEVTPPMFAGLTLAAILGLGGLKVMHGEMTLGALVAFQTLMASFSGPIAGMVRSAGALLSAKSWLLRLEDVHGYPNPAPARSVVPEGKLSGRIRVVEASFRYSPLDPPVVDGVSLAIEPAARVALVGPSGSGKSTLGRLIAGLSPLDGGEVRFDGYDRADLSPDAFAASAAYVDQDVYLFEGSLRDNLSLWDPSVGDAEMVQALRDAEIYDDVMVRPGGLDCAVGEGGTNFSGGQRQRLEIARALVGDPSILILDEATSALDAVVEKAVYENLRRRGCACLVIAHRLSAIRDCDEIVVMEGGRIVERGPHAALAAAEGPYARLADVA